MTWSGDILVVDDRKVSGPGSSGHRGFLAEEVVGALDTEASEGARGLHAFLAPAGDFADNPSPAATVAHAMVGVAKGDGAIGGVARTGVFDVQRLQFPVLRHSSLSVLRSRAAGEDSS